MPLKQSIAWGCGIAALVCLAGVAAIALFFAYVSQDVKGVGVSVNGPTDVVVGQTFELSVTVTNERPRKVLSLSDVDISEDYLAGFTLSTIEPRPKSNKHVPIDKSRSFTFGVDIPPGATRTFTFALRAENPGLYRGRLEACQGARFIPRSAQPAAMGY